MQTLNYTIEYNVKQARESSSKGMTKIPRGEVDEGELSSRRDSRGVTANSHQIRFAASTEEGSGS